MSPCAECEQELPVVKRQIREIAPGHGVVELANDPGEEYECRLIGRADGGPPLVLIKRLVRPDGAAA